MKMPHNAEKKLKWRTLWDFSTSILSQNSKKNWKGGKFLFSEKKSHSDEKTERVDPLVSPGKVLRGKKEKLFWFSSLGQQVKFEIL